MVNRLRRLALILGLGCCHLPLLQAEELSGRVIESGTNKGLAGVNVLITAQALGGATNSEGYFVLTGTWSDSDTVLFTHVGYQPRRITVAMLKTQKVVILEPKPIMLRGVEVKGAIKKYNLDVPTDIKIFTDRTIRTQVPLDIGDLLRGEAALQVESASPISQTISIRGSNPDQVLILYDGIPIQSTRNAIGELSWININDVAEIQVIKGSQTTVFGEGGIGGVVNIEGTNRSPYWFNFNTRLGTHDLRDGYLGVGKELDNFWTRYSVNWRHMLYEVSGDDYPLRVENLYHNLAGGYQKEGQDWLCRGLRMGREMTAQNTIDATEEQRDLLSLRYRGDLLRSKGWNSQLYYRNFLTTETYFTSGMPHQPQARVITNRYRDESEGWRNEKIIQVRNWLWQLGGELQSSRFASRTLWDFTGASIVDSLRFKQNLARTQWGFYSVMKYHTETGLTYLPWMDWNWSLRYDRALTDRYYLAQSVMYPQPETGKTGYRALNYKIGIEMGGASGAQHYALFITNGANSRFPTLYDLYLNDVTVSPLYHDSTVAPERVNTAEIGLSWGKKITGTTSAFKNVTVKLTYFRNDFTDKIYYKPFIYSTPVALNAATARISGWEADAVLEMLLPITLSGSAQILNISDESLFPNKPDVKYQVELIYAQGPLTLRWRGFYEGQETAAATLPGGIVKLQTMQARRDMDLSLAFYHTGRKFDTWLTISAMNLFSQVDAGLTEDLFERNRLVQVNWGVGIK